MDEEEDAEMEMEKEEPSPPQDPMEEILRRYPEIAQRFRQFEQQREEAVRQKEEAERRAEFERQWADRLENEGWISAEEFVNSPLPSYKAPVTMPASSSSTHQRASWKLPFEVRDWIELEGQNHIIDEAVIKLNQKNEKPSRIENPGSERD